MFVMPSVCSLHLVGGNGPSEQWPDPLNVGMSKENRKKLESFGKGAFGCKRPNLSNTRKNCTVQNLEKQKKLQTLQIIFVGMEANILY